MEIIEVDLSKLRNHPLNIKVFGELQSDADADQFTASIREHGVQSPIQITPDRGDGTHLILSGHRRRQAAAKCGHQSAPCIVREDADSPEQSDLIWSEMNLQREMTVEQRARYYKEREAIEVMLAKQRQKMGKGNSLTQEKAKGQAKDKAANAAKMSRKTAEKAVEVVEAIDELEAAGDVDQAEDIRETLNRESVAKAHRKAKEATAPVVPVEVVTDLLKRPVPVHLKTEHSVGQALRGKGRELDKWLREVRHLSTQDGGNVLAAYMSEVETLTKKLKRLVSIHGYWTACPSCEAKGCERCGNRGWLSECQSEQLTADEKKALGIE